MALGRKLAAAVNRRKPPQSLGNGDRGQYFIPGLGEYGRKKNIRAYKARHRPPAMGETPGARQRHGRPTIN